MPTPHADIERPYPYLSADGVADRPNLLLDLPIGEPRNLTIGRMGYQGPGVASDVVPATLSRVLVNVNDRVEGENRVVALHGGLVGVAQDSDGALVPVAGWHIAPAQVEIDDVIDRIIRDHETTPPQDARWLYAPADLVAVYRRLGSAALFNGAWRILPVADHGQVRGGYRNGLLLTIIELADGRSIGAAVDLVTETTHWVVYCAEADASGSPAPLGRPQRLIDDPADIKVYGTSLTLLLDAALDSGGDITHLETGRLQQLE
jgi:hypothetical protein